MFLAFGLLCPLLVLLLAQAAFKGRKVLTPGNYALTLFTSLALTGLLATDLLTRLGPWQVLSGGLSVFSTGVQELLGFLVLANLLSLLLLVLSGGTFRRQKPGRPLAFWATLFAFLVLFRVSFFWAFYQFPLKNAAMVFGVLSSPLGGAPTAFVKIWALKALLPSLLLAAALMPALAALRSAPGRRAHLVPALVAAMLALTAWSVSGAVPLKDYYSAGKALDVSAAYSEFYRQHYVFPDSVKVTAPAQKRNLLFIFLESMEVSYQDSASGGLHEMNYTPELTELAKEHLNFSGGQLVGGGIDLTGTGWTISATVAKFMGVPMLTVKHSWSHTLPNAVGLTDILAREGYTQRYIIGSQGTMFNRTGILAAHGGVVTKDDQYYEAEGHKPGNHFLEYGFAATGFADSKLYEFVKQELDSLSRRPEPFNLITLTTDTHFKHGWLDEEACPEFKPAVKSDEATFKAAIRCASKQLGQFIAWAKGQPWFQTTTIVIVGDHLWGTELFIPKDHLVQQQIYDSTVTHQAQNDLYRRWVCIYINSAVEPATRFRQYSSFDIFPTTLEALGFEVEGHALGFGRSLFSSARTLVEEFGEALVNRNFTKPTPQYQYLLGDPNGKW